MKALLDTMHHVGLIPVIKVDKAEDAVPLCRALMEGGLPIAEITFRTQAAAEAICAVRKELPDMLTGAGTVTSLETAKAALDAGSQFVVTPGFNPQVVSWCLEKKMPVLPGCTTASEVESAQNMGLSTVKFFPAEQSGGLARIKALSGPYPGMRFIPTGGIGPANIQEYLAFDKIVACGGSFMVTDALVKSQDWKGITEATRKAMDTVAGLSLERVDLPAADADAAWLLAAQCAVFPGAAAKMLAVHQGEKPCLVFSAPSLERAGHQLEQRGLSIRAGSEERDAGGRLLRLALAAPLGGLDVVLVRKKA